MRFDQEIKILEENSANLSIAPRTLQNLGSAFLYTYGRFHKKVWMISIYNVKFSCFLIKRLDFNYQYQYS